jgi:hypothetical protein
MSSPYKSHRNHSIPDLKKILVLFSKLRSSFQGSDLILVITLLSLNIFIYDHINTLGINEVYRALLKICFWLPAIFFILNFTPIIRRREKNINEDRDRALSYKANHFTLFLSLLIFYATFFIGLLIFREKPLEGEIPYLKDGTIGMRSWQSKVIVKNIKVRYHDSLGVWHNIPDSTIYNENNWTRVPWNKEKINIQISLLEKRNLWDKLWYPVDITIKDSVYSQVSSSSFVVQNCALVFTPRGMIQKTFHDIRFDCTVKFEKINKPIDGLFPGFQLISFIDTNKVINEFGIKEFSEVCLEFNLGMNNEHMPYIAGLDYTPPTIFVSTMNRMERFGNYNAMKINEDYKISAVILEDRVLFLGNTGGSVKLFEALLSKKK